MKMHAAFEMMLESARPHFAVFVRDKFSSASLNPDVSVIMICEDRAFELATAKLKCATFDPLLINSAKDAETFVYKTVEWAIAQAVLEQQTYDRYNPAFFPSERYSVHEGRDL